MKSIVILLIGILAFFVSVARATVGETVRVSGYVIAYDKDLITLETDNSKIQVSRKFYNKYLAAGHKITIEIPEKDLENIFKSAVKIKK